MESKVEPQMDDLVRPRLASELRNELSGKKGFSERNLRRMIQFYNEYKEFSLIRPQPVAKLTLPHLEPLVSGKKETLIVQRVVAQLPWAHNVILIQKLNGFLKALGYLGGRVRSKGRIKG